MRLFRCWLALVPLFFPLYLFRFEVAGVPTTLVELLVVLTALWGGVLWIVRGFPRPFRSWVWIPFGLFFLAATLSMIMVPAVTLDVNGDPVASARLAQGIWKGWVVVPMVYFFMIMNSEKSSKWWQRVFGTLALSGVGLALWAIFQMVTGDFMTWDGRASGPYVSANYLSLYLAPVFVMTFIQWVQAWRRPWWGVTSVVVAAGLWGTQSYAAFIAVAVGLGFYMVMTPLVPRTHKVRMGALGLLVFSGGILMQLSTPKFQQFLDFSNRTSSSVRVEVYTIASQLIARHPVAGIGLGQFEVQYQVNAPEILGHAPYEWVMLHPHNFFLALWLNTGLVGLVAMGWLVVGVFYKGFHHEKARWWERWAHRIKGWVAGPEYQVRLVGLSMLVVILVHGLFDTPFFKNDLSYLWWLVLAMVI